MSQLVCRLSKLSFRNKGVFIQEKSSVRLFSTSPCLALGCAWDATLGLVQGRSYIGTVLFCDPANGEIVRVREKTIPQELFKSNFIGASQGWGFLSQQSDHNSLHISDLFNHLSASKSNTKMIPLPPLTSILYGQTKVVWNVAMSSSNVEDCVVAVKFFGRQLSMCKPGRDLAWTNILIPFDCAENSNLMYSKRDERFYLPAPGGNYLCSWDLHFNNNNEPKFNELVFHNVPQLPHSSWKLLDSCIREDHWVESPCGQSFLVKWYSHVGNNDVMEMVMVFREEEEEHVTAAKGTRRKMCYTQDIGDLCIFLAKNDPFCVVASSFPGLIPNSIYMMGRNCLSICDLTNVTLSRFDSPQEIPSSLFWIPPFSV